MKVFLRVSSSYSIFFLDQNLIFFKNETDSIYQAQLLYYEYMKKDCSESPILLVTESYEKSIVSYLIVFLVMNSIPARILSLKRTEGSLSSMKPRLTTTSNAILSLNLIAIILWGIAHPFRSPLSYSSLFCFYKHVDTFYIGLEENMHKMIELNAISSLSCFFSLFL